MTFVQLLATRHSLLSIDQTGSHYYKTIWVFLWSIPFIQFTFYSWICLRYPLLRDSSFLTNIILVSVIVLLTRLLFRCLLTIVIPIIICCIQKTPRSTPNSPDSIALSGRPDTVYSSATLRTNINNRVDTVIYLFSWFLLSFCFLWSFSLINSNAVILFVFICFCNVIIETWELLMLYCFAVCCPCLGCCDISDLDEISDDDNTEEKNTQHEEGKEEEI